MSKPTLSYSLADQSFGRTKSLGILNLSAQLGDALAQSGHFGRFTLFSNGSLSHHERLSNIETKVFDYAADSGLGRVRWDQWQCYSAARQSGNDWLLLPKGFASFVRKPPVRLAVYVHDVMHDFYAQQFPRAMSGFEDWYFKKSFAATVRNADVIFTNTEFTRMEILRVAGQLGLSPGRIERAGIGFVPSNPALISTRLNRIVLLVNRLPHKRTELAILWMRRWLEKSKFDGEIHLVGSLPTGVTVPSGTQWRHHLRPPDSEYQALLRTVRLVVYISEYEGFGMPPVEAAIAGACPVYSDLPPTREVMRDAGMRFSNDSFESFRDALDRGLDVTSETVEAWRDELLTRHSWSAVVDRVVSALASIDASGAGAKPSGGPRTRSLTGRQVIHIGGVKRWLAHLLGWVAVAFRTWRKVHGATPTPRRSVLILEPFGMGDVLLHEPMVRALCKSGFDVTICARSEWRPLFPSIKWIDSKIAWGQHAKAVKYIFGSYLNSSFRRFFRELRIAGAESMVGIDTRGDIRSVLLLYAAGCREVITLSSYLGSDLAVSPAAAEVVEFSPELRRWESNLHCLRPLQVPIDKMSAPSFPHLRKSEFRAAKYVGFIPIAPWQGKWWDSEKWQTLADWLRDHGWELRVFCGPEQVEIARQQVGQTGPIHECSSVIEWAEEIQQLTVLVTVDSGPMHLADALGVPVVALFGQGLLPLWAPSGTNSRVVTHQHDPRFRVRMPTEENTLDARQWMTRIQVSEVIAVLKPLLDRAGSPL